MTTPVAPQAPAHTDLEARARARLMNTYTRQPLAIASGHGVWVTDAEGRDLIDLVAGIAVNVLGHCHPAVQAALSTQAAALIHTSNLYYTSPQLELAELLVDSAFPSRVFFCNSGAEANEAAIKLARKWGRRQRDGGAGGDRGRNQACARDREHCCQTLHFTPEFFY